MLILSDNLIETVEDFEDRKQRIVQVTSSQIVDRVLYTIIS
jgi:hypothetical protein